MTFKTSSEILAALDQLIEKHHLLKHPFYQAWTEGRLSKDSLALYAEQYYQHVRAFPENMKQLASRSSGKLQTLATENVAEELDPLCPHPVLWRRFAAGAGASEESLEAARPLPGIAYLLDTFKELAEHGSLTQAVAVFYVYEAQIPEIAVQKIAGLRRFYDISDPQALMYFTVHQEADVRHRAAWRSWLAEQAESDASGILAAAERGLRALWGALDAVYPEGCAKN